MYSGNNQGVDKWIFMKFDIRISTAICQYIPNFIRGGQKYLSFYMGNTYAFLQPSMFPTKATDKNETHSMSQQFFLKYFEIIK
jgi:hypothetical protein